MSSLRFWVNDRLIEERDVAPTTTLLYYLRYNLGLVGTKEGCNEGDCGACTVAIVDHDDTGQPRFRAINACLVLLPMVDGLRLYTIEGLAEPSPRPSALSAPSLAELHPVQRAMVEHLGSQCGYCTPGITVSLFEACYRTDLREPWQLDDQLAGNLCRCTGYRPIMDAARAVAGLRPDDRFSATLAQGGGAPTNSLSYTTDTQRFFAPASEGELFEILAREPEARVVAGCTDLGLEVTKRFAKPPCLVSLDRVTSLRTLSLEGDRLVLGATARLADVEAAAGRYDFPALGRMLRFFGARQVKHRATVGGNLCSASPIGDLAPILSAYGATAILRSAAGERELALDEFIVGYRKTALRPGEILAAVRLPRPSASARLLAYKVSKRQELDISIVAAGLFVETDAAGVVTSARFAFGGMAARPAARALEAEAAVVGQPWSEASVEAAARAIAKDFSPIDDHRGSAWYRRTVAANLLRGFYTETATVPQPRLPYRPTATLQLTPSAQEPTP